MKIFRFFPIILVAVNVARVSAAEPPPLRPALDAWRPSVRVGLAAAYINAEGVTFAEVGHLALDRAQRVSPDTLFEIGSVTKVFTGVLLSDAIERGVLELDQTVGPPFPASRITYRQLATHTSGLPRMPSDFRGADPHNPYHDADLAGLVRSFAMAAPSAKPAKSAYSNFGFAVLGQAVAAAQKESWDHLLQARVLQPLGLQHTSVSWRSADPKRLAAPHSGLARVSHWDLNAFSPAGSIVSSTRDLARFVQAMLGFVDTPLAPVLARTLQPMLLNGTVAQNVGLAWQLQRQGTAQLAWHNGQTGGYRSFVGLNLTRKTGVVLLANETTPLEPFGFHLLTGKPLPPRPSAARPVEALRPLLGHYPLSPSFIIEVTADGENLFVQATAQPRFGTRRLSENRFALVGVPAEITFERKPGSSDVTALILHQNGLDQRAPRLAAGEAPPQFPPEITLSADELDAYVGRFALAPDSAFTLRREGDRLFAQLTGQPAAPVFAKAKDRFFYKAVNAELTFERDSDGKVVALILHQHGRDTRAPRLK